MGKLILWLGFFVAGVALFVRAFHHFSISDVFVCAGLFSVVFALINCRFRPLADFLRDLRRHPD